MSSLAKLQELEDAQWLRRSFMMPRRVTTQQSEFRRFTTGRYKFTDTTLGGNFAINPPAQYTDYADLRMKSKFSSSKGMGRFYSESIDDNSLNIHLRFGVPQFNSLTNFFFNFYNPQASELARTGRGTSVGYKVGEVLGFVVTLPFQPIIWAGAVINFLNQKPVSRYYYLKPTMPLYWSAVSTMINMIGVNMGLINRNMSAGEMNIRKEMEGVFFDVKNSKIFHEKLGDVYREDGGIDIYKVANRAQRLAHQQRVEMLNALKEINGSDSSASMWESIKEKMQAIADKVYDLPPRARKDMADYLAKYHEGTQINKYTGDKDSSTTEGVGASLNGSFDSISNDPGFLDHARAELQDGSQFITLRVDDPGPVSESFSSSTTEPEIAGKLNSMSSKARSTRFSFADGNLGDGPILGLIESAVGQVVDVVKGAADSVKMSGLIGLAGNAFVDIPKVWESSSAQLPSASYTIKLRSPYGNPRSRFQNIIVPLTMILAGALPLSTGKQSYTSPFLVELYSKGRNQIRLGIIDSLSITRGTGNIGWTPDGEPLGIDISFSIVDLSSVLHMPISANFGGLDAVAMGLSGLVGMGVGATGEALGFNTTAAGGRDTGELIASTIAKSNFDDDNLFTDYMAVLGSLSLADQIYPTNLFRIRRLQTMAKWEQWKSPAYHANWIFGSTPARLFTALAAPGSRQ